MYAPTNYTGLNYRLPRVLQWLAHGQWWWIHTPNYRMNDRACGIEWLTAPLLLFTKSDRACFSQLHPVPAVARTDFQRLHAAGRPRASRLAMDVAAAHRLHLSPPGRQHRQ